MRGPWSWPAHSRCAARARAKSPACRAAQPSSDRATGSLGERSAASNCVTASTNALAHGLATAPQRHLIVGHGRIRRSGQRCEPAKPAIAQIKKRGERITVSCSVLWWRYSAYMSRRFLVSMLRITASRPRVSTPGSISAGLAFVRPHRAVALADCSCLLKWARRAAADPPAASDGARHRHHEPTSDTGSRASSRPRDAVSTQTCCAPAALAEAASPWASASVRWASACWIRCSPLSHRLRRPPSPEAKDVLCRRLCLRGTSRRSAETARSNSAATRLHRGIDRRCIGIRPNHGLHCSV